MKTSDKGIALIKRFEGLRLVAYKPVATEKYWTIGYGHYGADVKQGMRITEAQATEFLKKDLAAAERTVNTYVEKYKFNINQFSALVSFTYNCGAANFKKLINNGKRTIPEISTKLMAYNKAGGKELAGLTKRRAAEKVLFDTPVASGVQSNTPYSVKVTATALSVRATSSASSRKLGAIEKDSIQLIDKEVNGWGHLANDAGWISLKYTMRV